VKQIRNTNGWENFYFTFSPIVDQSFYFRFNVFRSPENEPFPTQFFLDLFCVSIEKEILEPAFFPPNDLIAVYEAPAIELQWQAPESGSDGTLIGYRVYRNEIPITDTIVGESFSDADIENDVVYSYFVKALYVLHNGESGHSNMAEVLILNPPSNLNAIVDEDVVVLTWEEPALGNVSGYLVFRGETFETALLLTEEVIPYLTFTDSDVPNGTYIYYVIADYILGRSEYIYTEAVVDVESDVSEIDIVEIVQTELVGNFPNPFNPQTTIHFEIGNGKLKNVNIDVYNVRGQRVRSLINGEYGAGSHSVVWNGTDDSGRSVSSGLYFYRMTAGEYTSVRRMMLLK
jgi:hypothetical protein